MFSDAMLNLATKDGALLGYALEMELPDGDYLRAHSGVGDIVIDGHTYNGAGDLGSIDPLESETDENPTSVKCTLNGLNQSTVSEVLQSKLMGCSAQIMMLVFDSDTRKLAMAEAALIGFVTDYDISVGDSSSAVSVTISDEFQLYEIPLYKYWTDASHTVSHPGDRICKYVAQMGAREIHWGSELDAVKFNKVK